MRETINNILNLVCKMLNGHKFKCRRYKLTTGIQRAKIGKLGNMVLVLNEIVMERIKKSHYLTKSLIEWQE